MNILGLLCVTLFFIDKVISQSNTCRCIVFYQCRPLVNIVRDGRDANGTGRLVPNCQCNCKRKDDECCHFPNEAIAGPPSPLPSSLVKKCGFANPDGVGFKIGLEGEDSQFGEFPWMVTILINGNNSCGGTLIHPSVVLTAAHCVNKRRQYIVRAGEWDLAQTNEIFRHQDRKVSEIKIHEEFQDEIFFNDVALLFLETPFALGEHINVACLPVRNIIVNSEDCIATGWGKNRFETGATSAAILKKITLPMVARTQCQTNLRQTRLGRYFRLNKSFVCAGGGKDQDTCVGDGGGPLICPMSDSDENRYHVIGITSWGIGCNEENVPGVYVNVPLMRTWIDTQMKAKNFDRSIYEY